eukprot:jgi/Mesvir1/6119/Mv00824-RA.1
MGIQSSVPLEGKEKYFSMGKDTYRVPMRMHKQNRLKLREKLVAFVCDRDGISIQRCQQAVVLLQGGEEIHRNETDTTWEFRQESFFAYLFGVKEPGFFGALDLATGDAILFIPKLPPSFATWFGTIHPPAYFKAHYEVDHVFFIEQMPQVLSQCGAERPPGSELSAEPVSTSHPNPLLYLLKGENFDSGLWAEPADITLLDKFPLDSDTLYPVLSECRVHKSPDELRLMRYVNQVSSAAHVAVMRAVRPGMMEYELESLFLHLTYSRGGCRHPLYTPICACGPNSAVLHYGHAGAPNDRLLRNGDMALLDMGAEYHYYGSDITCSFPVNGKFTPDQKIVYEAVLAAHDKVISRMKPGVWWVEMHRLAEWTILEKLADGGVLRGEVDKMMAKDLGSVFMPHGLGHLLGLDVHDVGGFTKEYPRVDKPGVRALRTARRLEKGMVITVEPGCYFIRHQLEPVLADPDRAVFLNTPVITRLMSMGGVRIESNMVITSSGATNLTDVPRTVADVEAVMAGADWVPRNQQKDAEASLDREGESQ